jgi:hypothetical protein
MGQSSSSDTESAWLEVRELVDDAYRPLVQALEAADVRAPDAIGVDLVESGAVAGMAEIAWIGAKVALVEDPISITGWTIIHFNPYDPAGAPEMSETVAQLIKILEGHAK